MDKTNEMTKSDSGSKTTAQTQSNPEAERGVSRTSQVRAGASTTGKLYLPTVLESNQASTTQPPKHDDEAKKTTTALGSTSPSEPSHFYQAADAIGSAWYAEDETCRPPHEQQAATQKEREDAGVIVLNNSSTRQKSAAQSQCVIC